VVRGQAVAVGSIHGVATDPDSRRRGHYRRVMDEVLAYCDERYETRILTTEHPEYFAPFGFRTVTGHLVRAPGRAGSGSDGVRLLDTDDAAARVGRNAIAVPPFGGRHGTGSGFRHLREVPPSRWTGVGGSPGGIRLTTELVKLPVCQTIDDFGSRAEPNFFTINLLERRSDLLVRHIDALGDSVRRTRREERNMGPGSITS
jgi:hypothetical protein